MKLLKTKIILKKKKGTQEDEYIKRTKKLQADVHNTLLELIKRLEMWIMTRNEFETKSFDEVMEQLNEERDDITTYENLKEFAISQINEDRLFLAIHILELLNIDTETWYEYDYCMGTLQTPSSITTKEDVEHLIED